MATSAPTVRLDRVYLTDAQLTTEKIVFYQMADLVDRLMLVKPQYTKLEVPNG